MLKRLLVTLDYDDDTPTAIRHAVEIAQRHEAEVTGLALVDQQQINAETKGGGIGAMYFAERLRQQLTEEARAQAHHLLRQFAEEMERAGVRRGRDHVEEGVPFERIIADMKVHDLLVVGQESRFLYPYRETRTHALDDVVEQGAAAAFITPAAYRGIERVIVAYDGSLSAARAMQKFAELQPFGAEGLTVELVHVRGRGGEARAESELTLQLAQSYLRAFGFGAVEATGFEGDDVKDGLLEHARRTRADLIVSGAHTRSGLSRFFLGSTAGGLLKESEIPLFLYR